MNVAGTDVAIAAIEQPAPAAPALPVEGHVVRAALAAERARTKAAEIVGILSICPRESGLIWSALTDLQQATNDAIESYHAYDAVRSCAGQG